MRAWLLLAAVLMSGCGRHEKQTTAASERPPVTVDTVAAKTVEWPAIYEATGTVRARTSAMIAAKLMGYVREVKVQAGDAVRAGQMLVVLDARDQETGQRQAQAALEEARNALPEASNGIAAAKAQLDLAQVTTRRLEDLFRKKSISNQEYDEVAAKLRLAQANHEMALSRRGQLEARIRQAEEAVKSAEVMRSYTELHAPFGGMVTERRVEPGNLAAPGAPLLIVEQAGSYRLEAAVEESRLGSVRVGESVSVELDALEKNLNGRVSEIVPSVDAASRSFTVKIDLPGTPRIRSGLFGRARFVAGKKQALVIPKAAVSEQGQVQTVLVADGGHARSRMITAGAGMDERVEVLSGLAAGEHVIVPRPAGLADGMRVEVRR